MNDLPSVFFEIHSGLERESPGTDAITREAWNRLGVPPGVRVVDMGCGPGAASLVAAELGAASVLAVDLHQPFLNHLDRRAGASGLDGVITTRCADMATIAAVDGPFDLVWSEGAIYNLGFEAGLRRWRELVSVGGLAAVSDLVWLTDAPPPAAAVFFEDEYPDMRNIDTRLEQAAANGWSVRDYFLMGEDAWDTYYDPIQERVTRLLDAHGDDPEAIPVLSSHQEEINVRRDHGSSYGSVFFLLVRSF